MKITRAAPILLPLLLQLSGGNALSRKVSKLSNKMPKGSKMPKDVSIQSGAGPGVTVGSTDSATGRGKKEQSSLFNLDGIPHGDKKRPNILIILADDVGTGDLPVYYNGSTAVVDMPNIQRLAGMGVTFLDAHASPLCAPSRYMLLSGNYPHRGRKKDGTWTILGNHNQFGENQKSIAKVLQEQANYTTAMFGKWHVGGKIPVTQGWSNTDIRNKTHMLTHKGYDWSQPLIEGPQDTGFASSFVTPGGIQSSPYAFLRDGYLTMNVSEAIDWPRGMKYTGQHGKSEIKRQGEGDPNWESSAYNMIIVNETEAFLDNRLASESDDPFFAYVALGAVHGPHTPPNYFLDGTPIAGKYPSPHMDMLFEMDKAVGSLVTMVEDRGLAEDTIIIFASDNGGVKPANDSSEHGHDSHGPLRGYKGSVYEGGHRVPLIFRWDGNFPAGETRSKLVSITDIYKTLCQITDIKKPAGSAVDSNGLTEYIYSWNNTSSLRRNFGAWDFVRKDSRINAESIQSDNLKLVVHYDHETNTRKSELYDLDKDIGETNNIASQNAGMRKKLLRRLRKIGPCPNKDVNKSFKLAEAADQRVTCQYFRDDISRCNLFFVGEINCPTICQSRFPALCKATTAPTVVTTASPIIAAPTKSKAPTPMSPISSCVDDDAFTFTLPVSGEMRHCDWFKMNKNAGTTGKRQDKLCGEMEDGITISSACCAACTPARTASTPIVATTASPITAAPTKSKAPTPMSPISSSCVDDDAFTFTLPFSGEMRHCDWFKMNKNAGTTGKRQDKLCGEMEDGITISSACCAACRPL